VTLDAGKPSATNSGFVLVKELGLVQYVDARRVEQGADRVRTVARHRSQNRIAVWTA
jgi:hypothetical protein